LQKFFFSLRLSHGISSISFMFVTFKIPVSWHTNPPSAGNCTSAKQKAIPSRNKHCFSML